MINGLICNANLAEEVRILKEDISKGQLLTENKRELMVEFGASKNFFSRLYLLKASQNTPLNLCVDWS